jgi:hypothetical protein
MPQQARRAGGGEGEEEPLVSGGTNGQGIGQGRQCADPKIEHILKTRTAALANATATGTTPATFEAGLRHRRCSRRGLRQLTIGALGREAGATQALGGGRAQRLALPLRLT